VRAAVERAVDRIFWTGVGLGLLAGWLIAKVPEWLT
jgi:hypothetical protein